MSSFVRLLTNCFHASSYQSISTKKDDDLGIEEALHWKKNHPINASIIHQSMREIDAYANNIIKGLKRFPITSGNKEIVKDHLVSIGSYSNYVKTELIKKITSCKGDKSIILEIELQLIMVVSAGP